MARRVLPSVVAALLLVVIMAGAYVPVAQAATVVTITTSNGSGCSSSILGVPSSWSSSTHTCTISGMLIIGSARTLNVGAGVTITVSSPADGIQNSGTVNNYGTIRASSTASGNDGLYNMGKVYNYGTLTVSDANSGSGGLYNSGTVNNYGTITATGGSDLQSDGVLNEGTINNVEINATETGSISATGGHSGIYNGVTGSATINDDGTISATGGFSTRLGTINLYCGVTLSGVSANHTYSCYTTTFGQSGIPTTGVTWGLTATWGPFPAFDYTGTGANITVQLRGALTYSYDTPVTSSGTTYACESGCSGTATSTSTAAGFSASATYGTVTVTTTAVSCSPSSVSVGSSTTCTATVTGSSPTGTITFSTSSGATSQFNSTTCTLSSGACGVSYTPSMSTTPVTITASYGGDSNNLGGSGTAALSISKTGVTTAVSCSPSPVLVGSSTTCTATVTGSSPTGTITFTSSSGTGTFTPSGGQCSLSSGSCSVTYSDTSTGSPTITASYGGDSNNVAGSGTYALSISPRFHLPPIPPGDAPGVLNLTTYGGMSLTAYKVGMLDSGEVIYNVPSINQTLLNEELSQGNFALFPNAVNTCSTIIGGQAYVSVSGFSYMWWGGSTNSTEFVFGGWESFLTSAQGWSTMPACSG